VVSLRFFYVRLSNVSVNNAKIDEFLTETCFFYENVFLENAAYAVLGFKEALAGLVLCTSSTLPV
jgi:hypothetical protein